MLTFSCQSFFGGGSNLDVSKAINPVGLEIDPQNYAYIFGQVMTVNGYKVEDTSTIWIIEGGTHRRPVRVPADQQLYADIKGGMQHHYRRSDNTNAVDDYETIQTIVLPPLEHGRIYWLTTGTYDIDRDMKLLRSFEVRIAVVNTETNGHENISTQRVYCNPPIRPK